MQLNEFQEYELREQGNCKTEFAPDPKGLNPLSLAFFSKQWYSELIL